jgi:hypothetical protein
VVAIASLTLVSTLHAAFYWRNVAPDEPAENRSSHRRSITARSAARVSLAALVLLGLVVGSAAIRTAEVGVGSDAPAESISSDAPDEVVAVAVRNTAARSRTVDTYEVNGTELDLFSRHSIDLTNRRQYSRVVHLSGELSEYYVSDSVLVTSISAPVSIQAKKQPYGPRSASTSWGSNVQHIYGTETIIPQPTSRGWQAVETTQTEMVAELSDPEQIATVFGETRLGGSTPPLAPDSRVTVTVDRQRGVLESVSLHLNSTATGETHSWEVVYRDAGSTRVAWPAGVREKRLREHLFDALYY